MPIILKAGAPANFAPLNAIGFIDSTNDFTPVSEASPLPTRQMGPTSLIGRLRLEGDPLPPLPQRYNHTDFSAATGRAIFIETVNIWATTPCFGRFQVRSTNVTGGGNTLQSDIGWYSGPNSPAKIPVGQFVRAGLKPSIFNWIQGWADPAVSGTQIVGTSATGFQLADSLDFFANKVIVCVGDSTWNGTRPSSNATCIPRSINDHYRLKGIRSRYILKAFSGSNTLGRMNKGRQASYPNARLIVFAPTPVQDAALGHT